MQQQQRASFVNNKRGRSKIARDGWHGNLW
jgi:hypothetical protein